MFRYALLCVLSSFAIILKGKRELLVLLCFVFLASCYFMLALCRGAKGWSAVCDCGISLSYSLAFLYGLFKVNVQNGVMLNFKHSFWYA